MWAVEIIYDFTNEEEEMDLDTTNDIGHVRGFQTEDAAEDYIDRYFVNRPDILDMYVVHEDDIVDGRRTNDFMEDDYDEY